MNDLGGVFFSFPNGDEKQYLVDDTGVAFAHSIIPILRSLHGKELTCKDSYLEHITSI